MAEAVQQRTSTRPELGSFRDWDSRVFLSNGRVLRALSAEGIADWRALESCGLYRRLSDSGELVGARVASAGEIEIVRDADPAGNWQAALSHDRVPFVSYPYEWTFSMLQDAALLQLRLMSEALDEGLVLKDASPYNIQWKGSQPVFIDVGSFERLRPGEPWAGYRQFCMLFLYPLMLEAYRGVPFHAWLRGSIDGIAPADFRSLFGRRDALRSGMFRHVFLHAALERSNARRGSSARDELEAAGFDASLIKANVDKLTRLVQRLRSRADRSAWADYSWTCSYGTAAAEEKESFVKRALGRRQRTITWDLGCNDGRFSAIASRESRTTIALDADPVVVDGLYRSLRERGDRTVLPLVVDLTNPSPALGWRNAERSTLIERGAPDFVLCLALVHHLSISAGVPLREIVSWLRRLEAEVVVEFPDRSDEMVRSLLERKRDDAHPDYGRQTFELLLREMFQAVDSRELVGGRTLYHVRPR